MPDKKYYNGYAQLEDGVGSLRCLLDDFELRKEHIKKSVKQKKEFTIACSECAKSAFELFAEELNKVKNINLDVHPIKSNFWGKDVNVAGLITAHDLTEQLKDNCFKDVIIPSIVLRPYTTEFLDGMNVKDVEKKLGVKLHIIEDIYSLKELFDLLFN